MIHLRDIGISMKWSISRSRVEDVKKDVEGDNGGGRQPAEEEADESSDDGDNE